MRTPQGAVPSDALLMGVAVSTVIVLLSVLLSFRLSSEDAIVEDMRGVIEAVSNETVANTESFLAPAERSAEELSRLLERGRLDDEVGLPADELFFDILRVNETFDGIFVGRGDGSFTYVIRNDVGGYTTKEIAVDGAGGRRVTSTDHDEDHTELSSTGRPIGSVRSSDPSVVRPGTRGRCDRRVDGTVCLL